MNRLFKLADLAVLGFDRRSGNGGTRGQGGNLSHFAAMLGFQSIKLGLERAGVGLHFAKVALQCSKLGASLAVVIGGQLELAFEIGLYGAQFDILGLEFAFPLGA